MAFLRSKLTPQQRGDRVFKGTIGRLIVRPSQGSAGVLEQLSAALQMVRVLGSRQRSGVATAVGVLCLRREQKVSIQKRRQRSLL